MGIIVAIGADHRTRAGVEADRQPSIQCTLQDILGPLVIVSDSKIALVRQSAKEFLFDLVTRP